MTNWFETERCASWKDVQELVMRRFGDPGQRWLFRGHQDASWDLASSLERVAHGRFGHPFDRHAYIEWRLRRRFERNLHRFATRVPRRGDDVEWWALMQHHGAPTRLLDWTYSFYIALFFAVERAQQRQTSAVWAIDQQWLMGRLHVSKHPAVREALSFDRSLKTPAAVGILVEAQPDVVAPLVPYFINERVAVQQGVFLAPMNLGRPFMENLRAMAPAAALRRHVVKIVVRGEPKMLAWLNRLNVNRLSLFPGIDGFASDLATMVAFTGGYVPPDWRRQRAVEEGELGPPPPADSVNRP